MIPRLQPWTLRNREAGMLGGKVTSKDDLNCTRASSSVSKARLDSVAGWTYLTKQIFKKSTWLKVRKV